MLMTELDKASHRNFTTGFMFSSDDKELMDNENVGYIKKYSFIGTIIEDPYNETKKIIGVRNQFKRGDELDVLQPGKIPVSHTIKKIIKVKNNEETEIANPNDEVIIPGLEDLDKYAIFRIKK